MIFFKLVLIEKMPLNYPDKNLLIPEFNEIFFNGVFIIRVALTNIDNIMRLNKTRLLNQDLLTQN